MKTMIIITVAVVILVIGFMLQRAFKGPSSFDRMNALGVIGADTILLVVLFGYLDNRIDMYVDIAIAYAVLGFVGSVVIAKYIGGKKL